MDERLSEIKYLPIKVSKDLAMGIAGGIAWLALSTLFYVGIWRAFWRR